MQHVAVLGATGSIGSSTLDVIARHPDRMRASVLAAGSQVDALLALCRTHRPDHAVIADANRYDALRDDGGRRERIERVFARVRLRRETRCAQAVAQCIEARCVGDHRVVRRMRAAECDERVDLRAGREHARAQAAGVARDDIERAGPDRAGGAEDCDLLHGQKPSRPLPSANTGRAASQLSMRSSTPP